jgi:hypothetical protein
MKRSKCSSPRARTSASPASLRLAQAALRLTMLGIVIGVTTVIAMVSIIEGFNNNIVKNFQAFGATLVQFQKFDPRFGPGDRDDSQRQRKNLTYEDATRAQGAVPVDAGRLAGALHVSGRRSVADLMYNGKEATPDLLAGVNEDYPIANNHFVGEGRFINEADVRRSATGRGHRLQHHGLAVPARRSDRQDRHDRRPQVSGGRRDGEAGRDDVRVHGLARLHADHDVRQPLPARSSANAA